jgi:hypothetical protein
MQRWRRRIRYQPTPADVLGKSIDLDVGKSGEIEEHPAETPDCATGTPSVCTPVNIFSSALDRLPGTVKAHALVPCIERPKRRVNQRILQPMPIVMLRIISRSTLSLLNEPIRYVACGEIR